MNESCETQFYYGSFFVPLQRIPTRVRQSDRTDCARRNKSDRYLRSPHRNLRLRRGPHGQGKRKRQALVRL